MEGILLFPEILNMEEEMSSAGSSLQQENKMYLIYWLFERFIKQGKLLQSQDGLLTAHCNVYEKAPPAHLFNNQHASKSLRTRESDVGLLT